MWLVLEDTEDGELRLVPLEDRNRYIRGADYDHGGGFTGNWVEVTRSTDRDSLQKMCELKCPGITLGEGRFIYHERNH